MSKMSAFGGVVAFIISLSTFTSRAASEERPKCAVSPLTRDQMTPDGIRKFLNILNIKKGGIGDFVCCLPPEMLKDPMVVHSSIAGQNGTPDEPRVIMSYLSKDERVPRAFLTANTGHPKLNQANSVEAAFIDEKTGRVVLYDITHGPDGAKMGSPNPPVCLQCHGSPPHLIFDGPNSWPRLVRGMDATFMGTEIDKKASVIEQSKHRDRIEVSAQAAFRKSPRFKCLDRAIASGSAFQMEVDQAISLANKRRVAHEIVLTPDYDRIKFALVANQFCPNFKSDLDCQMQQGTGSTQTSTCIPWFDPSFLRSMTGEPTIWSRLKSTQNAKEMITIANQISNDEADQVEARIRAANKSSSRVGFDFHFLPSALPRFRSQIADAVELPTSPILARYALDSMIQGNGVDSTARFLFESRGVLTNTWGTDVIAGYQRNGISIEELMKLELPDSRVASLVAKLTAPNRGRKGDEDLIRQTCDELRSRSLSATRPRPVDTKSRSVRQ